MDTPIAMLTLETKHVRRAVEAGMLTSEETHGAVVLAYRNQQGYCLLTIPEERYDALAILRMLEEDRQAPGARTDAGL